MSIEQLVEEHPCMQQNFCEKGIGRGVGGWLGGKRVGGRGLRARIKMLERSWRNLICSNTIGNAF